MPYASLAILLSHFGDEQTVGGLGARFAPMVEFI